MLPFEYGSIAKDVLDHYAGLVVPFTVTGVKVMEHVDKNGNSSNLLAYTIGQDMMSGVREAVGIPFSNLFNAHMTLLDL